MGQGLHCVGSVRKCVNPHCKHTSPELNVVTPRWKAGGRNWSQFVGKVLCGSCVKFFRTHGELPHLQAKKCTYRLCREPEGSNRYTTIDAHSKANNQEWSLIIGEVLCRACYERYQTRGTLDYINTANKTDINKKGRNGNKRGRVEKNSDNDRQSMNAV